MPTLHILLRVPFADCSGVIQWMKTKSGRILCAEHLEDEEITSTHCHVAYETDVSKEAIRKQLIKHSLEGTKHSRMEKVLKTHELYDFMELAKYCIKGDRHQLKETSLTSEEVIQLEKAWVNRVKKYDFGPPDATTDVVTNVAVNSATQEISGGSQWDILMSAFKSRHDYKKMNMGDIRRWIKSFYLQQKKPIPRQGDTNRYAYSLFAIFQEKTSYEWIPLVDEHEAQFISKLEV